MHSENFEWDDEKDARNIAKHGVSFAVATFVFFDPDRIVARDLQHSGTEQRFFCFGKVGNDVMTVRFTWRGEAIRIFGAGYWRKGKAIYERENPIHKWADRQG
jgi:uncharacterized DUF497 family protein